MSPLSQSIANALADPKTRGRYMGLYSLVTGLGRTMASSISSILMPLALEQPLILWGFVFAIALSSSALYTAFVRDVAIVSRRA